MTRLEVIEQAAGGQATKIKGSQHVLLLDMTTANMLKQVYAVLKNDSARAKFNSLDWDVLVPFCWSLTEGGK